MATHILGISAFYHDSAACLVRDGQIVAASQEERHTRIKHDASFPKNAIEACLRIGGVGADELDAVVFYEKPLLKFDRLLENYLTLAPRGLRSFLQVMRLWLGKRLGIKREIREALGPRPALLFSEHHLSHAASAFYPSPFEEAAILTLDGAGEWTTTTIGAGRGRRIELLKEIRYPHSLGLLYTAFTYFTGFKVNSGEYKLMGLAPYGEPVYRDLILEHLVDLRPDGSFRLDLSYFDYMTGFRMTNRKFSKLFGGPPHEPEAPFTRREMDLAASIQSVTEEIVLHMARHAHEITGARHLVMAGGVALNCVANGRVLREGPFDDLWVQPASGDAGGALGAALAAWHGHYEKERTPARPDGQQASLLGEAFSDEEIEAYLEEVGASYRRLEAEALVNEVVGRLTGGRVVGWFQGRMEFGPRALGNRSILGDARSAEMQSRMNLKIKGRESFRPFAPTVMAERISDYFEIDRPSPYMLLTAQVAASRRRELTETEREARGFDRLKIAFSDLPAITHVDGSARVQSVDSENPLYHRLLRAFEAETGCPVVINTSFNTRGEPIVRSPREAFRCLMRTEMDDLAIGSFLVVKEEQDREALRERFDQSFELD